MSRFETFRFRLQSSHETFEDRTLHINTLRTKADLAAIGKCGPGDAIDGLFKICICKNDCGVLTAQFKRNRPNTVCSGLHNFSPGPGLPGKSDSIHARMLDQKLAC